MRFGNWIVRLDNLTIEHVPTGYGVDLERCDTPAAVLDWVAQVSNKGWDSERGCPSGC